MGLKIGELGPLGWCETGRHGTRTHVSSCSLKPNQQAQLIPPSASKFWQSNHRKPQFCARGVGPSLAPGQTLPRAVETGLFSPGMSFPGAQRAIPAGV